MTELRTIIFAKAPRAGFAKTRLIPQLGAAGAACLAQQLLQHAVQQAQQAQVGVVELCVTPEVTHEDWKKIPLPDDLILSSQGEGDLGARLARAAQRGLLNAASILLVGTDCPALSTQCLQTAALQLQATDIVLIPAHDGGYVLLGLKRFVPELFQDIPWSTHEVAAITVQRAQAHGLRVTQLAALPDIDNPEDLAHLPTDWRINTDA
jgi:uncharacterized protein